MQLGDFTLDVVSDGTFALDGGAMFGVVPKVLWQRSNPADEKNRIRLAMNCLLIRTAAEVILVDTGIGSLHDRKFMTIYDLDRAADLLTNLAALGVTAEAVTKVICTHLHFDHCGGNCQKNAAGKITPTFPNATYYVNAEELAYANNPDPRSRASYIPILWEPVAACGQLETTTHNQEIVPGVRLCHTPGHTENHQVVLIESGSEKACFLGDLVPTSSHLKTPYVMGYDLNAQATMLSKEPLLQQAFAEQWLLFFEHCPKVAAGYLREVDGRLHIQASSK